MKKIILLTSLCLVLWLASCQKPVESTDTPYVTPEPTEDILVTFEGTHNLVVRQGETINLLDGVSAKDQYGNTYTITVIEAIDYDVIDRYEITYKVDVEGVIFTENIYLDVVQNEERSELYRKTLEDQLAIIQQKMDQEPYRFRQSTYDPANDKNYKFLTTTTYQYFDTQTQTKISNDPKISSQVELNYISFMLEDWYTFRIEDTYLFSPLKTTAPFPNRILDDRNTYFSGYVDKKNDTYIIQTALSELATFKDENHLLGLIYNTYFYSLSQKNVSLTMEITVDHNQVSVDVLYDVSSSTYDYFTSIVYDFDVSDHIDTQTLAHVDAQSLNDVKLGLNDGQQYQVSYSMMMTRYFKMSVIKDTYYEITGMSIHALYFYNQSLESVSLNIDKRALFSGDRWYFMATYDGDIYIEYRRNSMPFNDTFDFMYRSLEKEPTITPIILDNSVTIYSAKASMTEGVELIIPIKMNTYYAFTIENDDTHYYFKEGVRLHSINSNLFIYNTTEPFITIYIFEDLDISWVEGNAV